MHVIWRVYIKWPPQEKRECCARLGQADKAMALPRPTLVKLPALIATKKEEFEKELLETFQKVEINIPLLNAIRQVPRYAKFLKKLCTLKKKLKGNKILSVGENVSTIIQHKLSQKYKDLGMFTIPCTIENQKIKRAMLNLGASINVMPHSVYASLKLDPLKQIGVIIQLADRSNVYPEGVIEDVLVKINNLIFPGDFYVLYMEDDASLNPNPILLRRPFLKTAKIKIDVDKGILTMEFDGETAEFDVFKEIKNPFENQSLSSVNMINVLDVQEPIKLKAIHDAKGKRKKIVHHNSKSRRSFIKEFNGIKYKRRSHAQGSSYFPT